MVRMQVIVRGRVQGVSFRAWTKKTAQELGINGWVKNRTDGSVEVVGEGTRQALQKLVQRMRRDSQLQQQGAQVDTIAIRWQNTPHEFSGFIIVY